MCQLAITIPDEVIYDTKMSEDESLSFGKKHIAMAYYVYKKVSLGYCAQIAGMNKEDFIRFLSDHGVSIFHFDNKQELAEEMNNA